MRRPLLLLLAATAWLPAQVPTAALLRDYHFRALGPASAGGRVVDISALATNPNLAVVAAASGGVWKTDNAGTTWTPIFDHYSATSIGAVALSQPDPQVIWIGTGEANNRNSVFWGDGVYKSTDGGRTFTNTGLRDTFQIARIVTHPTDPSVAYVAAVGDLWGPRGQRGLFKTTDGGATWTRLANGLPTAADAGATDLVMDASHPNVLYAAFYQRRRKPWRFDSGGPDGGIFKTTDAGAHWSKLAGGLPTGPTGRIGLALFPKNPNIVMAIVEAPAPLTGIYRSEDAGAHWRHLNPYNNRPFYYSQIRINPANDQQVYVLSTNFEQSSDGGKTFRRMPAPFGPNYDYHAMWIDPQHPDQFYLGGDKGLWLSRDAGATMHFFDNLPIEQFYKVATDRRTPYAIYGGLQDNGAFGTMSFTRDVLGIRNDAAWKMHWDDGQYVAVDPTNWRRIYSEGTQGTFRTIDPIGRVDTPRRATPQSITNPRQPLRFNWTTPFILSPHDPDRLYYGAQYLLTSTDAGRHWTIISPDLSKHDPAKNQIGTGGITPDNTGAESYATIYAIAESPLIEGMIWCGTDDGNIWLTRDGGSHWQEVDHNLPGLPADSWVSRIVASAADPETAYAAFDDHRSDDYGSYLYKTTDGGRTWSSLSAGLQPNDPVYVITEDDKNPNLLFAGSELGLEVSLDAGRSWTAMHNGLPNVAVFDAIIQPQTRDLVLATHGRGIYVLDDLSALEQTHPALASVGLHWFTQRPETLWVDMSRSGQLGNNTWAGENPPDVAPPNPQSRDRQRLHNTPILTFYAGSSGAARLEITSPGGQTRQLQLAVTAGITRYVWDGRMTPPPTAGRGAPPAPLVPGVYQLDLYLGNLHAGGSLTLVPDPLLLTNSRTTPY